MIPSEEKKLLIKIAQMYYEQDLTQSQISKELGIYRTTISRMLKTAREKGIVKISIQYDTEETYTYEETIKNRFGLKHVIVVPIEAEQPEKSRLKAMGQASARFIRNILKDNDIIGFSWGSSLAEMVNEIQTLDKKNIICIPMVGGPSGVLESRYHVNTICYNASLKLHGNSVMIDVPAIVGKKETRNDIIQSNHFQEIAKLWNQINIAIFGIGSANITSKASWSAFYGDAIIKELEEGKVVGDICSRFFDALGNQVNTSIYDRTISIQLDVLKKTRYSIGIAESAEKVSAIIGALNGGYLNVLVTTEDTARQIVEHTKDYEKR
ncbi:MULTISPECIES: sugar-binding transcriptional regulator [Bacillus]|uniref:sugar-binding transcriptional regulator n=1 Tax=Bacillus TaxID=1386 RepID=UPI0003052A7B|nr:MULTISPECIES: sugar-binding transcriptional regulator [Bacillus]